MFAMLNRSSLTTKAWLILACFAIGLGGNVLLNSIETREQIRSGYEREVIHLVDSAISILDHFHQLEESGHLARDAAQQQALAVIGAIRFDGDHYIFVGDDQGVSISNAVKKLVGRNIMGLQDGNGKAFVQELYAVAQRGGGFVEYQWPSAQDKNQLVTKTSYARRFAPWGWTLGTGLNMEALGAEIRQSELSSLLNGLVILALLAVLVILFARTITAPLQQTIAAMRQLSQGEGDLTQRLPELGSQEVRQLVHYFNRFVASIQTIVKQINEAALRVNSATTQLTSATRSVDDSLNHQRDNSEQLASAMEQILAAVNEVASRTQQAMQSSNQAARETANSQSIIQRNIRESEAMADDIRKAGTVIAQLAEDSKNVDTVLDVIRDIAEQTNLLALNAAIEAARAGEAGRGFAVVADEVRTLSQRTQDSTREIQTIIEKLQQAAAQAVQAMKQGGERAASTADSSSAAGAALDKISAEVAAIEDMNQQIAAATEEQSQTVETLTQNVINLRDLSIDVAKDSDHVAGITEELQTISNDMVAVVQRFKIS